MALTFPRDLPFEPTIPQPFQPMYQQTQAITGGGSVNAAEVGDMLWVCDFETKVLDRATFAAWVAWLESLRGGLRMFKGRPPCHKWPIAHPKGFTGILYSGSQWSGIGNLSAIGSSRDTISINQVPNGITLSPGDGVSIPVGSRQHFHKITEGRTSASGSMLVSVEPPIMPGVTTGIDVRLDTPWCEMVLEGGTYSARREGRGGSVSFTGVQVLL
jgi:hypothetical protein